jgi:UDP-N-acetylmuramate dehydrogenase
LGAILAEYTTYKVGGKAEVLALPENESRLKALLSLAKEYGVPFKILGLGSNVLVSDEGVKGLVICMKNMSGVRVEGNFLSALAGTPLDTAVLSALNAGLGGIEDLSAIPGSVGGAIYMNAGAFGQEAFDNLESFRVITYDGDIKELSKKSVKYGYRKTEGIENAAILSARWELTLSDKDALFGRRTEILEQRKAKQPLEYPSAGSVFKRPEGDYASRLIDECGLRGLSVGGAQVSQKHAGFIINRANASSSDIKELIALVREEVFKRKGVKLELEQIIW